MPHYHEIRNLPYTAEEMFNMVADIPSYPEFVPWNSAARIISTKKAEDGYTTLEADLIVNFKLFRESFRSKVALKPAQSADEPWLIEAEYMNGPLKYMRSQWCFEKTNSGCCIAFDIDFDFKSSIFQSITSIVFKGAIKEIVLSFEKRASQLYKAKSLQHLNLN